MGLLPDTYACVKSYSSHCRHVDTTKTCLSQRIAPSVIFLRLTAEAENSTQLDVSQMQPCHMQMAQRTSNNTYRNDVLSANELAKGYARPIQCEVFPSEVPNDIKSAHESLQASRKLSLILQPESTQDDPVNVGDLAHIYIKQ